jgi:hypothetical protein
MKVSPGGFPEVSPGVFVAQVVSFVYFFLVFGGFSANSVIRDSDAKLLWCIRASAL